MCSEQIESAYKCINDLDWQVSKAKHVIQKYKDLVVKMQLQLNSKQVKIDQLTDEKRKYKDQ